MREGDICDHRVQVDQKLHEIMYSPTSDETTPGTSHSGEVVLTLMVGVYSATKYGNICDWEIVVPLLRCMVSQL